MSLIEIHSRLGNTALFYTIVMAAWGLWRYIRKQNVDSSYWGALVIAEVLYLAQGGLGAYLFLSGIGVLQRSIHILYGGRLSSAVSGKAWSGQLWSQIA